MKLSEIIPYTDKENKKNNLKNNAENKGVQNGIGFFKQKQRNDFRLKISKVKFTRKQLRELFK